MYKVIKSEKKQVGRFAIIEDTVEKDGREFPYSYVTVRHGVCVMPLLQNGNILMIQEYRHPIRSWQYQFPSGMIDDGETPEEAAKRELLEETGHEATALYALGYTYPSFGSTNEKIYLFAAECTPVSAVAHEALELIRMQEVSPERIGELLDGDLLVCASAQIAWGNYTRRKDRLLTKKEQ